MLQIKCPHCQNAMALNAMPASGRVSCTRCGQQLVLQAPVKPAAPQPARAVPVRPMVEEDEIVLQAPPRAQVVHPAGGSTLRTGPGQSARVAKAVPVHHDEDDRPRGKKKKKKSGNNTTLYLSIGGGVVAVVVIIAAVFIFMSMSSNNKGKIELDLQAAAANAKQAPGAVDGGAEQPRQNPRNPQGGTPRPRFDNSDEPADDGGSKGGSASGAELGGSSVQPTEFGSGGNRRNEIFNYVLKSAVFIVALDRDMDPMWTGSGSLIDKKKRLVLTNHHVAGNAPHLIVFFPLYDSNKNLIAEPKRFMELARRQGRGKLLEGKLLQADPTCDLAVVQLPRLPDGVEALPLAKQSVPIGDNVHSVGNPGAAGALWVYAPGIVRSRLHKEWMARGDDNEKPHRYEADVIQTDSPVNPGDSGGPMVNDRGELVGVTQGGVPGELSKVSIFIDIGEVKRFLDGVSHNKFQTAWAPEARAPLAAAGGGGGVSAGNLTSLINDLENTDKLKRQKAAEALGELGDKAKLAIPSLIKRLTDTDDLTKEMSRAALVKIGPPDRSVVAKLGEILRDTAESNIEPRRYAAATLEKMGTDARAVINDLLRSLSDKDGQVRQSSARALGRLGRDAKELAKTPLEEMLKNEDRDDRTAAAEGLAALYGSTGDMESLRKLIKHEDADIRGLSFKALAKLGKNAKPALPEMLEMAKNDSGEVRKATMQVLAALDPADAKPGFAIAAEAVKGGDNDTRKDALKLLGVLAKDVQASNVDAIKELVKEADLRAAALDCLAKVTQAHKTAAPGKRALGALVEYVKEGGETGEAAEKVIGDLGADAVPALDAMIQLMDVPGDRVTQADEARVGKYAALIGKMGKGAVRRLRAGLASGSITRWGCAKALGEIGAPAKEALPDLRILAQREQGANPWMTRDIEEAIGKIQGR